MNDKILHELVSRYMRVHGGNIEELKLSLSSIYDYCIVKKKEDFIKYSIFVDETILDNYNDIYSIAGFIKNSSGNVRCRADFFIMVSNDENSDKVLNFILNSMYNLGIETGAASINRESFRVLKITQNMQDEVNELVQCLNYMHKPGHRINKGNDFVPWITYIIIGINVLFFIVSAFLSGSIVSINGNVLYYMGANYRDAVLSGEYYRLFTCMFLHAGIMHIGFNMYALYTTGPLVEKIYGRVKYALIYFVSGIAASIFSIIFSDVMSIGASGAIFGIFGSLFVFGMQHKNVINKGFIANIASVIGINLVMGFSVQGIDNFAHIGGLIGGAVTTKMMKTDLNTK